MIKSFTITAFTFLLFSITTAAQTIPQQIDKLAKDPKTAERAAKADVYIVGNTISNDSTTSAMRKTDKVTNKKKRKTCKKN